MPETITSIIGKAPPFALALGIVIGLLGFWPAGWKNAAKKHSKNLIQFSIVLLGFWISLEQVARAGLAGLALSTGAIVFVLLVSFLLQKLLKTERETGTLLCAGTSICGGSAIAATGSAINAKSGTMAAATAIVFILNAIGVYVYPLIGHALHLTDSQFGAWCAVGVHDVAGVVAAAKSYSDAALADATVIKLTRVLWIVPVALILRHLHNKQNPAGSKPASSPFPWFILFFVAACILRAILDRSVGAESIKPIADIGKTLATLCLSIALFLIGTGISRSTIATLGWRPIAHGSLLWIITSAAAMAAVKLWL